MANRVVSNLDIGTLNKSLSITQYLTITDMVRLAVTILTLPQILTIITDIVSPADTALCQATVLVMETAAVKAT